jgi:hypothetical protein
LKRHELEHLVRAAADIAADDDVVVVGSQAILATHANPPEELVASVEADLYPLHHPERADLIDGSIGEASPFHATYGYYAQGVEESTATLPSEWKDRLVPIRNENTRGVTAWCLEVHDLLISKHVAGREKDRAYCEAAVRHGLVERAILLERLEATPIAEAARAKIRARIARDFAAREGA